MLQNRLLQYIDKYRYFLNIDISIFDFSMYQNIEKYRFFDKQLLFNSYVIIIMSFNMPYFSNCITLKNFLLTDSCVFRKIVCF